MPLTFNLQERELSLAGMILLKSGTAFVRVGLEDIIHYSSNTSIGSDGLPLGGTESASYTLEINNVDPVTGKKKYTPEYFDGAMVQMEMSITIDGTETITPLGQWFVDNTEAPEQSVSITLNGYDALATSFEVKYTDASTAYPTTLGSLATAICTAANTQLDTPNFLNAAVSISKMPTWGEDVTARDILSYIAVCAGGYARVNERGRIEIVSFADGEEYSIDPSLYRTFTPTGGSAFDFNCIEAKVTSDAADYTRYAIDSTIEDSPVNTIQVDYNPLLTASIVNSIVTEFDTKGLNMQAGTFEWGGDPSIKLGDIFTLTTLDDTEYRIMVTSLTYEYDGGLSQTISCSLPSTTTTSSPSYNTTSNTMFDSNGDIRATRVSGLDRSIVVATVGHFENLTAQTAQIDVLLSSYIRAMNLLTDSLSANVIESETLHTNVIDAVTGEFETVTSTNVDTKEIAAALANVVQATIERLTAGNISADTLTAALADFVALKAKTSDVDYQRVKDLVADDAIIKNGIGDSVYIDRLSGHSSIYMSSVVDDMVIKGEDALGNTAYYRIIVESDGTIRTEDITTTLDQSEIAAAETHDGKKIVEVEANIEELNGENLRYKHGLFEEIVTAALNAGQINAVTAMIGTATIPELYTTSINSLANDLDFSANESITMKVNSETANAMSNYIRLKADGLHVGALDHGEESRSEVLIDNTGMSVKAGGTKFSRFASNYVQFGHYRIYLTADKGLAFSKVYQQTQVGG